jgi:hypothetical protein
MDCRPGLRDRIRHLWRERPEAAHVQLQTLVVAMARKG